MNADLAQMQAGGMHLSPTPAYFSIKVQQLRRALCHESTDFATGLIHTLDISSIQFTEANAQPHKTAEIRRPDSVLVRVDGPHYISDTGIEAIDVNIHYGDGDGGGKTVREIVSLYSANGARNAIASSAFRRTVTRPKLRLQ